MERQTNTIKQSQNKQTASRVGISFSKQKKQTKKKKKKKKQQQQQQQKKKKKKKKKKKLESETQYNI